MKIILLLLIVLGFSVHSYSQERNPDPRLIQNVGQEIYQIKEFRKDYYQYLLFELQKGFQVKSKNDLNNDEKKSALDVKDFVNNNNQVLSLELINSEEFNFQDFGLTVKTKEATIVKLSKKQYFVLRSKVAIASEFKNNPLNHK